LANDKKCVKTHTYHSRAYEMLFDKTPAQSRRTFKDCQLLAMWYGFQFFSFKEGEDDVGYCEISMWRNCLKQEEALDWTLYGRGYPRTEEEIALASFEESDSAEETKVIDNSAEESDSAENLKFTTDVSESVASLEITEPKFPVIQVFAMIGFIFISYSAYKRYNKSDYVDVPSALEPKEV